MVLGHVPAQEDDKVILCPGVPAAHEPLFCLGLRNLVNQLRSQFRVQASSLAQVYLYRSRVLRQRTHNLEVYIKSYENGHFPRKERLDCIFRCGQSLLHIVHNSFAVFLLPAGHL
jgi:hypothetical protein